MRWGTIGTSKICEEFIDGLKKVKGQQITAVYSRAQEKAGLFIEKAGLATAISFTDFEPMLNAIDAIYIASPNGLHYEQAKFFLENKKHVLLEKPFTFTVAEAKELIAIAKKQKVIIMEAYKPVHLPQYQDIKKWVTNNEAFLATLMMNQYSSRMTEVQAGLYRSVFDSKLGKGSTYDMLVYPVQLAIALFGPIKSQQGLTYRLENKVGITNLLLLEHKNGVYTTITTSKAARGIIPSEIIGVNGKTLIFSHLTRLQNIRLYEVKSIAPVKEIRNRSQNPFVFEIQDFVKMVEDQDFKKMNEYLDLTLQTIAILEKVEKEK